MTGQTDLPERVQSLLPRLAKLCSSEGWQKALDFKPRESDLLLTSGMKSGTTWVEQMLHGLRSRGDMDFEEICLAVPCLECAHDAGITDLSVKQPHQPQMYQSHLERHDTPTGFGKYIVVVRDPADSAVSMYHFIVNWLFDESELSLNEFVEWFIAEECSPEFPFTNPTQTRHMLSWYPHRNDENVLWLHYEDLIADVSKCIRMMSDFIGIGVNDPELLALVEKQASLEFMKQHKNKFDSHALKLGRNEMMGLPRDAGIKNNPGKVRNGKVNEAHQVLSPPVLAKVHQKWTELMQPVSGYTTYEEMRNGINAEQGRTFGKQ